MHPPCGCSDTERLVPLFHLERVPDLGGRVAGDDWGSDSLERLVLVASGFSEVSGEG